MGLPPASLTDLLLSVRMDRYGLSDIRLAQHNDLAVRCGARSCAHLILEGSLRLTIEGGDKVNLNAGDYVLLPHGSLHHITCGSGHSSLSANLRALLIEDSLPRIDYGEGVPGARFLTAVFGSDQMRRPAEDSLVPRLIRLLPDECFFKLGEEANRSQLAANLEGSGSGAVGAALMHALFTQAMKKTLGENDGRSIADHRLSPVGTAIRIAARRLDEPWPVEKLARSVGMSRSVFSAMFTATTGQPPAHYLAGVRMNEAAQLLASTRLSIGEVARQSGYNSQAAFTRAFKRKHEKTPERYRADARVN